VNIIGIFKEAKRIDADAFRWTIIQVIARLLQYACWAKLVLWAMYPTWHRMSEVFEIMSAAHNCSQERDGCYCGKFTSPEDFPEW